MIRRNLHIVVVAVLFFAVAQLLDRLDFWSFAGLARPHGFLVQGGIFLGLWFVLQNWLFDPYVSVMNKRIAETSGKRVAAQECAQEAERLRALYEERMRKATADATEAREGRNLASHEEQRMQLRKARGEAREAFRLSLEETSVQADRTQRELASHVDSLATDIEKHILSTP